VFSVFFCGGLWDEGVILGIQGLCGVREFYFYEWVCILAFADRQRKPCGGEVSSAEYAIALT